MHTLSKKTTVTSWSNTQQSHCLAYRPERQHELSTIINHATDKGIIAYGNGLNYGDEAFNSNGAIITTPRLNRILAFDPTQGLLTCEPGVTFEELLRIFLPKGWAPPVIPGSIFVTLGGAVANDVHGKNHHRHGSFGHHLVSLEVMTPAGNLILSDTSHAELFRATIGGLGLTGFVNKICLRLVRSTSIVQVQQQRFQHISALLEQLIATTPAHDFCIGWLDLTSNEQRGRGILTTANFSNEPLSLTPARRINIPISLPMSLIHDYSIRLFNQFYYQRIPLQGKQEYVHLLDFINPLDRIRSWNRLYGPRGLLQFQCVLPYPAAAAGLNEILKLLAQHHACSALAVIKTFWQRSRGLLSFPQPGVTLAVDFPNNHKHHKLMQELYACVAQHAGKIYLAKDSQLSKLQFQKMYPDYQQFNHLRANYDVIKYFQSDLSRRLGLTEL